MERNRIDLSKLERDDLRDLLSMARDEWVKYTNCKGEVEWCKKRIEEKEKDIESNQLMKKGSLLFVIVGVIILGYKTISPDFDTFQERIF